MKKKEPAYDPEWAKAKKVCRLNQSDIAMAKRLGLSPKTLMKNNPAPTQKWKAPVKEWIHHLYGKRFGQAPQRSRPQPPESSPAETANDDVPF